MRFLKPSQTEIAPYIHQPLVEVGEDEITELDPQPIQKLEYGDLHSWLDSLCPTPEELANIITTADPPTFLDKLWSAIQSKQNG